jgi:hypothetical protein
MNSSELRRSVGSPIVEVADHCLIFCGALPNKQDQRQDVTLNAFFSFITHRNLSFAPSSSLACGLMTVVNQASRELTCFQSHASKPSSRRALERMQQSTRGLSCGPFLPGPGAYLKIQSAWRTFLIRVFESNQVCITHVQTSTMTAFYSSLLLKHLGQGGYLTNQSAYQMSFIVILDSN